MPITSTLGMHLDAAEACFFGLLFEQLLIFHDDQRQIEDAVALEDGDLLHLGAGHRLREEQNE